LSLFCFAFFDDTEIRVHLQDRRTPVYGDDVYGIHDWNTRLRKQYNIERPLLHAYQLILDHPVTNQTIVFTAPVPQDMLKIIQSIDPSIVQSRPELFM
jgi:hypothetical protein